MQQHPAFLQHMNAHVQYMHSFKASLNPAQLPDCTVCLLVGHLHNAPLALPVQHNAVCHLLESHQQFHAAIQRATDHQQQGDELGKHRAITEAHQASTHVIQQLLELDWLTKRQTKTA